MLSETIQENISSLFLILGGLSLFMTFLMRDYTRKILLLFISQNCAMLFFVFLPVAKDIKDDLLINMVSILLVSVFTLISGIGIVSRMQENFNKHKGR